MGYNPEYKRQSNLIKIKSKLSNAIEEMRLNTKDPLINNTKNKKNKDEKN